MSASTRLVTKHILHMTIGCAIGATVPLLFVSDVQPVQYLAILTALVLGNCIEYGFHRWGSHQRVRPIEFLWDLHMTHHNEFQGDSYTLKSYANLEFLVLPAMVLNIMGGVVAPIICAGIWLVTSKNFALISYSTLVAYYLLEQVGHVIEHLPETHWILSLPGFRSHWARHRIHHDKRRMRNTNFNLFAWLDRLLGTNQS